MPDIDRDRGSVAWERTATDTRGLLGALCGNLVTAMPFTHTREGMAVSAPRVMVSSTFYDLKQVRVDLKRFLEVDLGYEPLLSEFDSFPVDPGADTVENCRRRVTENADILVLVVGGRYGQIDEQSRKSVTNLEYLTARAKGIPIIAFVKREVLAILPMWISNPLTDFSAVVDDSKVLSFIHEFRDIHNVWTHEFDTAQDITSALRHRFAHLMRNGLEILGRLQQGDLESAVLLTVRGRALRLVLERPRLWEFRLFFQVILDEISDRSGPRRLNKFGLAFGETVPISMEDCEQWLSQRNSEILRLFANLESILKEPVNDAMGPPGRAGNPEAIIFIAKSIGRIYEGCLDWTNRVRCASGDAIWNDLVSEMSKLADGFLDSIESWAQGRAQYVEDAVPRVLAGEEIDLDLRLEIKIGDIAERVAEVIRKIGRHYGLNDLDY